MTSCISIKQQDSICDITLNRPEVRNVLNAELITELTAALKKADKNPSVHVICIQGSGNYFCAGADINWMKHAAMSSMAENIKDAKRFAHLLETLAKLNKPSIALVKGGAHGGALGLIACCDLAIATKNAIFNFPETRLGLIPAIIAPYISRAIGERQAKRYFLTTERFTAEQAKTMGLIHEVVETHHLERMAKEFIDSLEQNSPNALKMVKKLFPPINAKTVTQSIKALANIRASKEGRRGIQAFLEKSKPIW